MLTTKTTKPTATGRRRYEVCQHDDGLWSIGWHDDALGPFESRTFAQAVASNEVPHEATA